MKRAISAFLAPVFAGAFILSACILPTQAQTTSATVVSSCGTPPSTYSAGANRALTQDTTGTLCSTGSGGSGSNAAAGPTGSAVPADASYNGLNVGGTLRGQTGVNPSGTIYAARVVDLSAGLSGATAPTYATLIGSLDGSGNLQPNSVSNPAFFTASSLPLPTGAATAANQATMISSLATIVTNTGSAIPAGSAIIGKVGIDQTTPGTTNNVTVSTNVGTLPLVQATVSAAISIASGTTTQIIAASGSTVIRIMQLTFVADAANTVTYESADTGGSCANPVALSGAEAYAANGGESDNGLTFVLPSGKAFCILTTAAGHGHVAYAQF